MRLVFAAAVGWSVVMTTWLVRRLTREHQAITEAVTRVAQGDLTARVARFAPGGRVEPLGLAVDEMISRMDRLVTSQQRFVAHAAHELRLPLTTLLGELSLALRKDRDDTAYREAIEQALGDTRRLKLLADDLLTLARIGSAPERPKATLALRDVAFGALEVVRASAKARGVSLGVDGDGRVHGHAADLKRLVQNLLENAVRHSPAGAPRAGGHSRGHRRGHPARARPGRRRARRGPRPDLRALLPGLRAPRRRRPRRGPRALHRARNRPRPRR
jgi:two-component system OmpR family sensor kinase